MLGKEHCKPIVGRIPACIYCLFNASREKVRNLNTAKGL
jgi:hypothetical protein